MFLLVCEPIAMQFLHRLLSGYFRVMLLKISAINIYQIQTHRPVALFKVTHFFDAQRTLTVEKYAQLFVIHASVLR